MSPLPAPLVINERSGAVVLVGGQGAGSRKVLTPEGRWPSIAPDGRHVTCSAMAGGEGDRAAIVVHDMNGERHTAHRGTPGPPSFIAPNVPHYFLWSPRSDAVSYVVATERGLELAVSSIDGTLSEHVIATGAPLFHSWSDDGAQVAFHAGSRVALFDRATLAVTEVDESGVGFRTPRFLPSGEVIYAAAGGGGIRLMARSESGDTRQLAAFAGGLAFDVVGDDLLVAVTRQPDASLFDSLWWLSGDGPDRTLVARGPFAACWPAPAGEAVVLLVPSQAGDGSVSLQARAVSGEVLGVTEAFVPSGDLRVAIGFFDQYGLSHPLWSPDGGTFVVSGRVSGDGVSASFGDAVGDYVMSWQPGRSRPLEQIVPGTFASFPRGVAGQKREPVNDG